MQTMEEELTEEQIEQAMEAIKKISEMPIPDFSEGEIATGYHHTTYGYPGCVKLPE